ncbi:Nucleoside triphosphate pyrophosphohydrolase MazG [Desulfurella amilsii]|uniref:Nucleoside triphosphate pyrophosphohydrolase MazG n=1 Tax=Desulfurella amilsii TaxID=1562698 RepID=A0A1X4XVG6_9BACT|nr:nucleoside triphosphate pyrophosphohydrolase [Desulfurella amilsii]OSS41536.1 Nucleoside triphosphate pyrophosphohydrolase MazG [Desulfurella amilsii]
MCDVYAAKFNELVKIVERLRKECPWDREQTNQSIKNDLIEEAFELYEALEEDDNKKIIEELGDCMLQVIFHCVIKNQNGEFSLVDVVDNLINKLIRRHPHVFGEKQLNTKEEVLSQWDDIKQTEKDSLLDGIPKRMPALLRAYKVQKRLSKVGFDFEDIQDIFSKIYEELEELKKSKTKEQKSEELGDVVFSLVNLARFFDIDPQEALHLSVDKIVQRFEYIEKELNGDFKNASLSVLNKLWGESKVKT